MRHCTVIDLSNDELYKLNNSLSCIVYLYTTRRSSQLLCTQLYNTLRENETYFTILSARGCDGWLVAKTTVQCKSLQKANIF